MSIKAEANRLGLDAVPEFWAKDEATLAMMTGGCGPGRFGNFGLFDSAYGLSIKPACAIHDFDYATGSTPHDKKMADLRFLGNMLKIINTQSKFWPYKVARRYRAVTYYSLVADLGDEAFRGES